MCCDNQSHHNHACGCGHGEEACQCGQTGQFRRRFQTKEEQIASLEQYLAELQAETRAVNERITQLKKG